jgi:1-acyl-sn-glycerol-3-phosphate acyltransferase
VLGNDPFERGAAVREPTPRAEEPLDATAADTGAPVASEPAPRAGTPAPAAAAVGAVRARLAALEQRVESATDRATARLESMAQQEASGQLARDLFRTATALLPAIWQRLEALASLRTLFVGSRDLDPYGMDRELVQRSMPIADFLYRSWWRVDARQIENVPATGPVVIVANHAGVLPWDAFVLRVALLRDHPARREMRPLLDEHAFAMPVVGGVAGRLGAVRAAPENALRLLGEGGVVGVFPEGSAAASRSWHDRYRVERFGRGGFARIALAAGATIVPCAIVGSEETSVPLARAGWLSEVVGMPFLASPAPALARLPLGALPLPARWSLRFGPPIEGAPGVAADAEETSRILDLTERTRAALQQMLDEDVAARRSVYL